MRNPLPSRPFWFVLATADELGKKPIARRLFGTPIVLFRDGRGVPHALLDRCPHRNVPLSVGRVLPVVEEGRKLGPSDGRLACAYHGWQFDGEGTCRHIPSFRGAAESAARKVPAFATREQDGLVWVYAAADRVPTTAPFSMPLVGDRRYTIVRQVTHADAGVYATAENALDVPHTAFLHKGLFRSESRNITLEARIVRTRDRVSAEYIGEPRPPGIVAAILSPSGGTVTHFDRFILPSIAQVEYRIGEENHILVTSALTPVTEDETKLFNVVALRTRIPARLIAPFVKPLALYIFQQDAAVLRKQRETIREFGGEHFASTEIDVLGRHIALLLKDAARQSEGEAAASGNTHAHDDVHEEVARLIV